MAAEHGPEGQHEHEHLPPGMAEAASAIEHARRRRRLRVGLLTSVFTLALATLGGELFLRLTRDRERAFEAGVNGTLRRWAELTACGMFEEVDDPLRRYAMRPGAHCVIDGWTFRVNAHRARGAELPTQKPGHEKRLLALGDSFCFGMWADEDETLVGHLTVMANAAEQERGSGVTWRAVNLGVPGYHSGQQLRALEQDGLALEPDAVLLYYNTNDLERPGFFFDDELGVLRNDHLPLPIRLKRWLWHSHLYGYVARRHNEALRALPHPYLNEDVPWAWVREDNQRATREAITHMVELCRERDIPFFFVDQPLMTWSGDARNPEWPVLPLVEWAEDLRRELGVPGVSLLGLMRNYDDGVDRFPAEPTPGFVFDRYFADEAVQAYLVRGEEFVLPDEPDYHLLGAGYGHIARVCYPQLREAGILP